MTYETRNVLLIDYQTKVHSCENEIIRLNNKIDRLASEIEEAKEEIKDLESKKALNLSIIKDLEKTN